MAKGIYFFIVMWAACSAAVVIFRAASNRERLSAAKFLAFGFITALLALIFVSLVVFLF